MEKVTKEFIRQNGNQAAAVMADYENQGGTSDYNDLKNKPKINGVTLEGNITPEQLGIVVPKRVVVNEEKLIGEWVEGGVTYDLYEKTVYFGELTNAEQKQVIHGVTNYVRFVGIRGMVIGSNNSLPLPFAAVDSTKNIYLAAGPSKITIVPGSDRTGYNAWVTLEYIKNKEVG